MRDRPYYNPWIRIASVVEADRLSGIYADSFNSVGLGTIDYRVSSNNKPYEIIWGDKAPCPLTQWACATCCYGMASPWGFGTVYNYFPAQNGQVEQLGSVRAWHFLADKDADVTKVFSIEKDDYINVLLYEFKDSLAGTATGGQAYQFPKSFKWHTIQV